MAVEIKYEINRPVEIDDVIDLYRSSGLERSLNNRQRIEQMFANSNLIVTARIDDRLIGLARSLTDFCFCCYLSDLAVRKEFQKQGIGKTLIRITKEHIGPQSMLLLLAAPAAIDYYPKIGMEKSDNAFIIHRSE